ncbi:lytic transglycosylase domain-containing protein [Novosphingobium sp.]|uniref:lytic transglycosylase domain-containing protein n=1 Tax=Novosphingobium sp. TaxID=1874826 RepID=UPI003B52EAA1
MPDAALPNSLAPAVGSLPAQMPVQTAIARAASATGVDFTYLLAQARIESGLDPSARARTSSARGLYQFTGSTWLRTLERHGGELGFDATAAGADPAGRAQLLALRGDPQLSALMAGALANDNCGYLYNVLGRDPDNAELYLAHFLGPEAAGKFLGALSSDPSQSAAALLPKAAGANHAIFFAGSAPRSVGEVMDLLRTKFDAAMQSTAPEPHMSISGGYLPLAAGAPAASPRPAGGPLAQEFAAAAPLAQSSMADTLASAFGTGGDAMPANVRAAYGQIRALGL